jgi:hypothetical protein
LIIAADERILIGTVMSSIVITVLAAILLLVAVTLTTKRIRAHNRFELGSVSQQWLLGHRGDER